MCQLFDFVPWIVIKVGNQRSPNVAGGSTISDERKMVGVNTKEQLASYYLIVPILQP
jgi:hypothetical protein